MATVVVLDDDAQNIRRTVELVEREVSNDPALRLFEATSIDQLLSLLLDIGHVDILISDIMLGEGQPSGIDVVQRLFPASSGTQVIYVSGYLAQATEVYRTDHVYFLLKPLDPVKLRDALHKAYAALRPDPPRMLRIMSEYKNRLINPLAIRYLESNLHRVSVHCGKTVYVTYEKLGELQAQLPASFCRCHRSYVVNLAFVSSLGQSEVRLFDGTSVPVSRRHARAVRRSMLAYASGIQT
jgi:DNA-binding LytR/AlgR family response regulator